MLTKTGQLLITSRPACYNIPQRYALRKTVIKCGRGVTRTEAKTMGWWRFALLLVVLMAESNDFATAIGLCQFAMKFPTKQGCPPNMINLVCGECEYYCRDPNVCSRLPCSSALKCTCVGFLTKDGDCVPMEQCGCFKEGVGVIPDAENYTYISDDCLQACVCQNDQLQCDPYLFCSDYATCIVQDDGVRKCKCYEGFEGNGESCFLMSTFTDCSEVYDDGHIQDGVYYILPDGWNGSPFAVFCNMTIDGGGWTVFQRRVDGTTDFFRSWVDYRNGFGNNQYEFWLGNEKLYHILQQTVYEVRVGTVLSLQGEPFHYYHKYKSFRIDNEINRYRVTDVGQWSGNKGGAMYKVRNKTFSTYDLDNDGLIYDCAVEHRGGWWYGGVDWSFSSLNDSCILWIDVTSHAGPIKQRSCTGSNPNGIYNGENGQTIFLHPKYCNISYIEMKVRPRGWPWP